MRRFECYAVIFDLDGVLVDSRTVVERHWRRWAVRHGLDADALMHVIHGRRPVEIVQSVAPYLTAEEESATVAAAEGNDTDGLCLVEGAARLLATLPAAHWAIATSGTRDTALTRLAFTGLPIPEVLVAADDVTHGKPHPEPYLQAAERVGVPPYRCVVLEDTPAGIEAACAAGMRVVAVAATHTADALTQADVVAARLRDVDIVFADDPPRAPLTLRVGAGR